jgi:protein SDA1
MNADLLQDLTSYNKSKDKGVMNAARSLISLYREVAPEMLLKKDRGKNVTMAMNAGESGSTIKFGVERNITTGIEGLELLEEWKKEQGELDEDNDDGNPPTTEVIDIVDWKEWEVGSEEDESDESEGWIAVSSDEDHGIEISDSEDDEPTNPPPAKLDPSTSVLATQKVVLHMAWLI